MGTRYVLEQNKKNVYPCKPQFYYIKVGCKGVFVTRTCFRDGYLLDAGTFHSELFNLLTVFL